MKGRCAALPKSLSLGSVPLGTIFVEKLEFVAKHTYIRLTLPLHFALTIIRTIGGQALRGTGMIVAGLLTLDFKSDGKIVFGLTDYLSLVVEAVVLPLLGILAIVKPHAVSAFLHKDDNSNRVDRTINRDSHENYIDYEFKGDRWNTFITGTVWAITSVPNRFLTSSTNCIQSLLLFDISKTSDNGRHCLMTLPTAITSLIKWDLSSFAKMNRMSYEEGLFNSHGNRSFETL
ncbi:MAG: hypothetical protein KR126chlam2_01308 [Chlamydiae bacterium]|nr:hypothetical protein [Chlamydiota bacterium]